MYLHYICTIYVGTCEHTIRRLTGISTCMILALLTVKVPDPSESASEPIMYSVINRFKVLNVYRLMNIDVDRGV